MEREEIIQQLEAALTLRDIGAATRAAGQWLAAKTPDGEPQDEDVLAAVLSAVARSKQLPVALPPGVSIAERIWAWPRAYRLDQLRNAWKVGELSRQGLRELLPGIWADAEPSGELAWWPMFKAAGPMTDHLPAGDPITVYRGAGLHDPLGIAWSLEHDVAAWFALRFNEAGVVLAGEVMRSKVAAYITNRNEAEVIAHPRSVRIISREPVDRTDTAYLRRLEA